MRASTCLALSLLFAATAACTKVQEQPVLQTPPPEAKPAPPPPPKAARPARPRWGFDSPAPAPRRPAEPPVNVDTLNGDPNGLKREDLQKTLDGAMPRFTSCFDSTTGSVNVSLSFDANPDGKAANLKVSGGGSSADSCVRGVVTSLRLPTFEGKPVPVAFPLSIHRTVTQTAPARPAPTGEISGGLPIGGPPMMIRP